MYHRPRRQGQSRFDPVEPLLRTINGKKRVSDVEASPNGKSPAQEVDSEDINAAPESTDDEDCGSASTRGVIAPSLSNILQQRAGARNSGHSSAAADSSKAKKAGKPRTSPERTSGRVAAVKREPPRSTVDELSDDEDSTSTSSKRARMKKDVGMPEMGSHHEIRHRRFQKGYSKGFAKKPPPPKIRAPPQYQSHLVKTKMTDSSPEKPQVKFIMPDMEDTQTQSLDSPETPSQKNRTFKSLDSVFSPPSGNGGKRSFKASAVTDSPLRKIRKFEAIDPCIGDDASPSRPQRVPRGTRFRALSLSSLSSLSEFDSPPPSGPSLCPMCDAPIDAGLLAGRSAITMTIAQQQRICQLHKRRDATAEWEEKGYPKINWESLERRFEKQHGYLDRVLKAETDSYYRDEYSRKIDSGKGRTLLNVTRTGAGGSLTPGYYGSRGARLMSEWLIGRFSGLLRKRAVKDRLLAARGHTTFVQLVLVPELAARLVAEDLDIEPEAAREVLRESAELGELVHEEIGDVVHDEHDNDNEEDEDDEEADEF